MQNQPDNLKAYAEACTTLRHYSNASLAVRSASVVQGLAILIPWANAITQSPPKALYIFALPVAGILFTVLLYRFHMGYFTGIRFFYEEAARMERKLFDEDFRPIGAYDILCQELDRKLARKLFTLNAPFVLIGTFFVAAVVVDIFIVTT